MKEKKQKTLIFDKSQVKKLLMSFPLYIADVKQHASRTKVLHKTTQTKLQSKKSSYLNKPYVQPCVNSAKQEPIQYTTGQIQKNGFHSCI